MGEGFDSVIKELLRAGPIAMALATMILGYYVGVTHGTKNFKEGFALGQENVNKKGQKKNK